MYKFDLKVYIKVDVVHLQLGMICKLIKEF